MSEREAGGTFATAPREKHHRKAPHQGRKDVSSRHWRRDMENDMDMTENAACHFDGTNGVSCSSSSTSAPKRNTHGENEQAADNRTHSGSPRLLGLSRYHRDSAEEKVAARPPPRRDARYYNVDRKNWSTGSGCDRNYNTNTCNDWNGRSAGRPGGSNHEAADCSHRVKNGGRSENDYWAGRSWSRWKWGNCQEHQAQGHGWNYKQERNNYSTYYQEGGWGSTRSKWKSNEPQQVEGAWRSRGGRGCYESQAHGRRESAAVKASPFGFDCRSAWSSQSTTASASGSCDSECHSGAAGSGPGNWHCVRRPPAAPRVGHVNQPEGQDKQGPRRSYQLGTTGICSTVVDCGTTTTMEGGSSSTSTLTWENAWESTWLWNPEPSGKASLSTRGESDSENDDQDEEPTSSSSEDSMGGPTAKRQRRAYSSTLADFAEAFASRPAVENENEAKRATMAGLKFCWSRTERKPPLTAETIRQAENWEVANEWHETTEKADELAETVAVKAGSLTAGRVQFNAFRVKAGETLAERFARVLRFLLGRKMRATDGDPRMMSGWKLLAALALRKEVGDLDAERVRYMLAKYKPDGERKLRLMAEADRQAAIAAAVQVWHACDFAKEHAARDGGAEADSAGALWKLRAEVIQKELLCSAACAYSVDVAPRDKPRRKRNTDKNARSRETQEQGGALVDSDNKSQRRRRERRRKQIGAASIFENDGPAAVESGPTHTECRTWRAEQRRAARWAKFFGSSSSSSDEDRDCGEEELEQQLLASTRSTTAPTPTTQSCSQSAIASGSQHFEDQIKDNDKVKDSCIFSEAVDVRDLV